MDKPIPRPTDAELSILRVLWERGPSTVREVHDLLSTTQGTGYTTILKLMQIMTEKGLVRRNESARTHIYEASLPESEAQRQFVGDLVDRVFRGSAAKLVLQALSGKKASADELNQIRNLLDDIERRTK